jgi:hypothetical protein
MFSRVMAARSSRSIRQQQSSATKWQAKSAQMRLIDFPICGKLNLLFDVSAVMV